MKEIFNAETGLIENIKYESKIFTEPDMKKKLDSILTAMKGIRVFERFGFNAEEKEEIIIKEPQLVTNYQEWEFNSHSFDWQNEVLTGYKPKPQLTAILANCIDVTSQ